MVKRVTIKTIAGKAGVAYQTVSKILNNQAPTVSDRTKERVLAIARRLNYKPNVFARSLRMGKTGIIGITYSGIRQLTQFDDPYLRHLYNGVGQGLTEENYKLIFHSIRSPESDQAVELAQQGVIDGLIYILFSAAEETYDKFVQDHLRSLSIPVVIIQSDTRTFQFPSVGVDFTGLARQAVGHLAGHGYQDIALVVPHDHIRIYQKARDGYRAVLEKARIPFRPERVVVGGGFSFEKGREAAGRLLAPPGQPPRAVFVVSDGLAYGLRRGLEDAGLTVPGDVALLGYLDNAEEPDRETDLAAVTQPSREKGRQAARMLLQMIQGGHQELPNQPLLLEPVLYKRKTCGCT